MYQYFFLAIVSTFGGLLFLNFYFRVKALRLYRDLVNNRVQFSIKYFFDEEKLEDELMRNHPEHLELVLRFVRLVKRSINMASALIVVIFLLGYTLMRLS